MHRCLHEIYSMVSPRCKIPGGGGGGGGRRKRRRRIGGRRRRSHYQQRTLVQCIVPEFVHRFDLSVVTDSIMAIQFNSIQYHTESSYVVLFSFVLSSFRSSFVVLCCYESSDVTCIEQCIYFLLRCPTAFSFVFGLFA